MTYRLSSCISCTSILLTCALLFALAFAASAFAQTGTSTIRGTVSDAQGQVIAGATVIIKNEAKNLTRTTTTDNSGVYVFTALPPNLYVLEVEAQGFKKSVSTNVKTLVDTASTFDISLEVGSITEVVTVTSTGDITVNTQDATLGTVIGNQQIIQLPLPDRNPAALLTLQAGVTREGYVAGARSDQSNITLDGVDINEAQTNALSSPVLRLNAEAIEEFRVTTSNANANQGRSSGAQISLITKGGTNNFRGALFMEVAMTSSTPMISSTIVPASTDRQEEDISLAERLVAPLFQIVHSSFTAMKDCGKKEAYLSLAPFRSPRWGKGLSATAMQPLARFRKLLRHKSPAYFRMPERTRRQLRL